MTPTPKECTRNFPANLSKFASFDPPRNMATFSWSLIWLVSSEMLWFPDSRKNPLKQAILGCGIRAQPARHLDSVRTWSWLQNRTPKPQEDSQSNSHVFPGVDEKRNLPSNTFINLFLRFNSEFTPEKWCLEDDPPSLLGWLVTFQGRTVKLREGKHSKISSWSELSGRFLSELSQS